MPRIRRAVVHAALILTLAACRVPAAHAQGDEGLPLAAELVFSDDFNRAELGSYPAGNIEPEKRAKLNWCVRHGKWEIRQAQDGNGYLWGEGGPADIILERPLQANFVLEYTTWSENPGDRSAFVCVPQPNFEFKDIYGFHFGAGYSQNNAIYRQGQALAGPVTAPLPVAGHRHHVIISKTDDMLRMSIDGQSVFSVRDAEYAQVEGELSGPQGLCVGLYTWSDGVAYDDLKVYNLPAARSEVLAEDAQIEFSGVRTFEGDTIDGVPAGVDVAAADGCAATIRNEPTVVYYPKPKGQALVPDHCLALTDDSPAAGSVVSVIMPLPSLTSGEVEVELLAERWEGECATVSLLDAGGGELGAVVITADGSFMARTEQGETKLADTISYKNRPPDGRLYFQPGRWFTLRLGFNAAAGIFHASIVNLYAGLATPGISWLTLGTDLPLGSSGPVCAVRVTTGGRTHLLVDNLLAVSPRAKQISGQSVTLPLRSILGLSFPMRKDPISLSVYSLRNEAFTKYPQPETPDASMTDPTDLFKQAAARYDELLIRQAYLQERGLQLSRMAYHLQRGARRIPTADLDAFQAAVAASRGALEECLRIYGDAYRDAVNEQALTEGFFPAADRLEASLASCEADAGTLSAKLIAAADGELQPPPSLAPGPYDAPLEWADGCFRRGGRPAFFYPPVGVRGLDLVSRNHLERALQFDNCYDLPFTLDRPGQPAEAGRQQSFPWDVLSAFVENWTVKDNPDATMFVASMFGCVHLMQLAPSWWMEAHSDDPDIFFCTREGKVPNWPGAEKPYEPRKLTGGRYTGGGGYWARLNIWNEHVRQMYHDMMQGWSKHMSAEYPDRLKLFALGLEQTGYAYTETGFNESAMAAFRARLQAKYGTIAALNEVWGTDYDDFAAINPRDYSPSKPNGLMYEFQVFRQDGYFEWMRLLGEHLHSNLPDLPTMNDFNWAFGGATQERALDLPRMFETYDIVGSHFYGIDAVRPMYRCSDSLRKAYGNPLGNFEWAADMHLPDLFNEDAYKTCGLLDMWEEMAWGRSVLSIWYGGSAGFSEGGQFYVPNLRQSVLRYSTGFMPVARERSRRFGEIALSYPTVTPKVCIIEPTASKWNGIDVYTPMLETAAKLEEGGWNYGFIYEEPLLAGRQSLEGISTLIVPRGICLKPETTDLLLKWIDQGGTLIALLPPGMLNQYGQPDGRLMREIAGSDAGTFSEDFRTWMAADTAAFADTVSIAGGGTLLQVPYGQGRLIVLTASDPLPTDALVEQVEATTPRDFYSAGRGFRLVGRVSADHLYLFVVNPDHYVDREDRIILSGEYGDAVDLGCDAAFPVKTTFARGATAFDLRLAPGEGTVVRLGKVDAN